MARHRANTSRRRRIRASVLGALVLALGATLIGQPAAHAVTLTPKGKIVLPRNADVVGSCKLEVNKVLLGTGLVNVTLTANARPAGLDGYRANKFTAIDCWVMPADDIDALDALIKISLHSDHPTVYPGHVTGDIPYSESYTLCGQAIVKLKNGDTSYTAYTCA
jgi:hypothetical protein